MPYSKSASSGVFFKKLSRYFSQIIILLAVSVLIGWQFNIEFLKRTFFGTIAMNPFVACCFILSGTAMLLITSQKPIKKKVATYLSYAISLSGAVKIILKIIGVPNGIDTILYHQKVISDYAGNPNTMAPQTAIAFILVGIAMARHDQETASGKRPSEYFALVVLLLALVSFMGYIYSIPLFYSVGNFMPMAFTASIEFLLLAHAILFAYPDRGLMAEMTSNNAGSIMARKIFPAILTFPIVLGLLRLLGEWHKLYDSEVGVAIYTISIIMLLVIATWYTVRPLNRADMALKTANKRLKERTGQLEELNKELESFTYSVSHDLRAPLRSINGYAKILAEDYAPLLDEEGQNIVKIVVRNAEKMGTLIDDLLDFSRLGRKEVSKTNINMTQLAGRIAHEQLHINALVSVDSMPSALGDYALISQVYQNLISNAIKYSSRKESPQIRVSSFQNEYDETVYYVRDNGAGFDMKYYHKLFGVFQRLHHDNEFSGTGVGLAIVKRIISKHGGEIWAEGTPNEGATFYFSLPKDTSAEREPLS